MWRNSLITYDFNHRLQSSLCVHVVVLYHYRHDGIFILFPTITSNSTRPKPNLTTFVYCQSSPLFQLCQRHTSGWRPWSQPIFLFKIQHLNTITSPVKCSSKMIFVLVLSLSTAIAVLAPSTVHLLQIT